MGSAREVPRAMSQEAECKGSNENPAFIYRILYMCAFF